MTPSAFSLRLTPTPLLVVFPTAVWFTLCLRLVPDWQLNPQYTHSWFVPILVSLLGFYRWRDRPEPTLPSNQSLAVWSLSLLSLTMLLLPVGIVLQANPDWRAPYWLWAILALGIALSCAGLAGGKAWLKHFAPCLALMLFAIPWPSDIERQISTTLLGGVVALTADILNLLGYAVARSANTLVFTNGQLGIEDACSGIRSLHGSLMLAYVLGELGRWTSPWRAFILVIAVICAFCLNTLRAILLGWQAITQGSAQAEQWHDPISTAITLITLTILILVYLAFEHRHASRASSPPLLTNSWKRPASTWGLVSSSFLFVGIVAASERWFDQDAPSQVSRELVVSINAMRETTRRNEIPYKARTQLRYSKGNSASWETAEGIRCTAYWFHWDQDRVSLFSEVHRPDVCLPSIGLRWIETRPHIEITTQDGTAIQFQGHAFEQRGQPIFVWYGVWDNELTPIDRHSHSGSRLRNTWQRKRVQSRQSIELILHGAHSWPDAEKTLAHWVSSAIKAASKSKHY